MSGKLDLISTKLKKLLGINELDNIKYELYGIITTIILSKEFFKRNLEIKQFLDELSLVYKEYVYSSRTILLARVIRDIEKLDPEEINQFIHELIDALKNAEIVKYKVENNLIVNNKKQVKRESNYMEEILKKYSRNKKD